MNTYTQYKAANAIETAAANNGGIAGAGVGLGAGLGFGQMMANTMNSANSNTQAKVICPHCHATVNPGKFCPECGASQVVTTITCPKCGNKLPSTSKFCPECGEKL